MPADIWYGADVETRIGLRANATTAPTAWQSIDFMTLSFNPTQEWRERAKLGVAGTRHNALDPIKPRKGFFRIGAELVLDADARSLPIWLRAAMGAPASAANSALYNHVFASGSKAEQYFDIVGKFGATDFRIVEGLTLAQMSAAVSGENTQDFNINLSLRGLRRSKATAWPAGAVTAAPPESPMLRALFEVDDVAADNMLTGNFTYDRALAEGIFLSATPTVSSNKSNGGAHSGSATFRAIGKVFDDIEEGETVIKAGLHYLGVITDHGIRLEHPQAMLQPAALPVNGPGMIERNLNWAGHQSSSVPATRITITNNVAAYA